MVADHALPAGTANAATTANTATLSILNMLDLPSQLAPGCLPQDRLTEPSRRLHLPLLNFYSLSVLPEIVCFRWPTHQRAIGRPPPCVSNSPAGGSTTGARRAIHDMIDDDRVLSSDFHSFSLDSASGPDLPVMAFFPDTIMLTERWICGRWNLCEYKTIYNNMLLDYFLPSWSGRKALAGIGGCRCSAPALRSAGIK